MWQLVLKYIPMDCSNFINSISLKVHVHVGIYMLNGVACLVLKKYSRPPPTPPPPPDIKQSVPKHPRC